MKYNQVLAYTGDRLRPIRPIKPRAKEEYLNPEKPSSSFLRFLFLNRLTDRRMQSIAASKAGIKLPISRL